MIGYILALNNIYTETIRQDAVNTTAAAIDTETIRQNFENTTAVPLNYKNVKFDTKLKTYKSSSCENSSNGNKKYCDLCNRLLKF